jgi:hypothetical protein
MRVLKKGEVKKIEALTSRAGKPYFKNSIYLEDDVEMATLITMKKPNFKEGDIVGLSINIDFAKNKVSVYQANA